MGGKEAFDRVSKGEVLRFCLRCGSSMVDAALYDPEGTVPLVTEIDSSGRMWVCIVPLCRKEVKAMKTLDEFNAERRKAHYENAEFWSKPHKNGIACPKCGEELLDSFPSITLTSDPPQKNIHCDACGYRGFRIA